MEVELEAKEIKNIVGYLVDNGIGEAKFCFDAKGLSFKGTDISQISLISIQLPASAFKEYKGKAEIGMDLEHFKSALNCFDRWDTIKIKTTNEEIEIQDTRGEETLKIPQTYCSSEELPNPEIKALFHAEISKSDLRTAVKHAKIFSEGLLLQYKETSGLTAEAKSSKGEYKKTIDIKENVKNKCNKCASFYSIDYLDGATKNLSGATIEFGENTPLHLIGKIGEEAHLEYWLAPRITETETDTDTEEEGEGEEQEEEAEKIEAVAL